jgi:hypothetical protein
VGRAATAALGAVVLLAGLAALVLAFSARDDAGLSARAPAGPGELQPDRGAEHGPTAVEEPGVPPTSGPHRPVNVTRDRRALSADQIVHALERGNVILTYDGARPPAALRALQEELTGPFDAELAAAGQAVILARRPGPILALAWRRVLEASGPEDPRLREFAEAWLGRGLRP